MGIESNWNKWDNTLLKESALNIKFVKSNRLNVALFLMIVVLNVFTLIYISYESQKTTKQLEVLQSESNFINALLDHLFKVRVSAGSLVLPGNNIFISYNYDLEKNNIINAKKNTDKNIQDLQLLLKESPFHLTKISPQALANLANIDSLKNSIVDKTMEVFANLEKKNLTNAAKKMALLDQNNFNMNTAINEVTEEWRSNISKIAKDSSKTLNSMTDLLSIILVVNIFFSFTFVGIGFYVHWNLIKSREEAINALKIKSNFLANMSHEIRTPMNAIVGMADLLSEITLNTNQKRYVSILKRASETLLSIINDILDISKIESGNLRIEKSDFNLKTLLVDIVEICEIKAAEKKLILTYKVDENMPEIIYSDALRVSQVLLNLVGNAIKFSDNGEILITVKRNPNLERKGEVLISVTDSGIGIPKELQSCLFDAFTQANSSVTKKYGGTGLGLAISKKLTEMLGGEIWFASSVSTGSTFSFTISCSCEKSILDHKSKNEINSEIVIHDKLQKSLNILLVDDSADNRTLIKEFLRNTSHKITEVENGELAVAQFKMSKFDIILMDIQMPVLDGFSATRLMRAWESEQGIKATPILAVTAYALKEEIEKCLSAGCDAHLAKPVKKKEFLDMLSEVSRLSEKNVA